MCFKKYYHYMHISPVCAQGDSYCQTCFTCKCGRLTPLARRCRRRDTLETPGLGLFRSDAGQANRALHRPHTRANTRPSHPPIQHSRLHTHKREASSTKQLSEMTKRTNACLLNDNKQKNQKKYNLECWERKSIQNAQEQF